nr:unnamed protein product [Digitaria exilis]
MIYEFVIIGSANINQRSMEGSRDTEIAMGAYQPHYNCAGQHLSSVEECFRRPETEECVRRGERDGGGELAEVHVAGHGGDDGAPAEVQVGKDGKVGTLPGHGCFPPDVGGKVLGAQSSLPNALTT